MLFLIFSCDESIESKAERGYKIEYYKNGNGEEYYSVESFYVHQGGWDWGVVKKFDTRDKAEYFKDSIVRVRIKELKSEFKVQ